MSRLDFKHDPDTRFRPVGELSRSLPLRLRGSKPPATVAVRGELFFPKQAFQKSNRERVERGEEPFANPRNAVAGAVRRLDPGEVARRPLDIVFYDILKVEGASFTKHWDELKRLKRWGLKTDGHNRRCSSLEEVRTFHERLVRQREGMPCEIDGVVLKADSLELWDQLGTRDRSPRWALAWKFEPRQEVTRLRQIVVQVGMTGMLTPVALLEPVDVGGVTVSRATVHNEQEVHRKKARKVHEAIQGAKRPRLDRFLYALGLRHAGRRIARLLAAEFGSLEWLHRAGPAQLEAVPEIGPEIAQSVAGFFEQPDTVKSNSRTL